MSIPVMLGPESDDENWVFLDPANDDPFTFGGQNMLNKRFIDAVTAENDLGVIRALDNGADIEARTGCGDEDTALILAAIRDNMGLVQILLDRGAKIDAVNKLGRSALSFAALLGDVCMVKELIRRGAPWDHHDSLMGYDPLMCAASVNRIETAKFLLDHGACIESRNTIGMTPFLVAVNMNHIEMVDLLVERGSDIQAKDDDGWNALTLGAPYRTMSMVLHLIELGVDINSRDIHGNSCVWELVTKELHMLSNVESRIQVFIDNGLDLEIRNNAGYTLLDEARRYNRSSVVEFLETYQAGVR